jgi:hypothetical protein
VPSYDERMTSESGSVDGHGKREVMLPVEAIQGRILSVRGHRVLLDADLARLYEVETRVLVQAVRRNLARFPDDFMFQLDAGEFAILRSQSVMSSGEEPAQAEISRSQNGDSRGWGGRRTPPYAFTEQGVAMLASVLRGERAVAVNIAIVRAFVQLRVIAASHVELARRLDDLEGRMVTHDAKHDTQIGQIIDAIRQLMEPPEVAKRPVGFRVPDPDA